MNLKDKRAVIGIVLLALFFLSFHFLDVGANAILGSGILENGFWWANAVVVYHLGMYGMVGSFVGLFVLFWVTLAQRTREPPNYWLQYEREKDEDAPVIEVKEVAGATLDDDKTKEKPVGSDAGETTDDKTGSVPSLPALP